MIDFVNNFQVFWVIFWVFGLKKRMHNVLKTFTKLISIVKFLDIVISEKLSLYIYIKNKLQKKLYAI